jgi:hypothetical protein
VKQLGFASADIDVSEESYQNRNRTILALFAEIAKKYPVNFISPKAALCTNGTCPTIEDGNPMFFDQDHLSYYAVSKTSHLYDAIWGNPTTWSRPPAALQGGSLGR